MLQNFIETLCSELSISPIPKLKEKTASLRVNEKVEVALRDLDPGISMRAKIGPCPKKRREDLLIFLMRANLLGQGTGGARIGLDEDEKTLTLSLGIPYEMNYQTFREHLEKFVNYLVYWREEVAKFEKEESIL